MCMTTQTKYRLRIESFHWFFLCSDYTGESMRVLFETLVNITKINHLQSQARFVHYTLRLRACIAPKYNTAKYGKK